MKKLMAVDLYCILMVEFLIAMNQCSQLVEAEGYTVLNKLYIKETERYEGFEGFY